MNNFPKNTMVLGINAVYHESAAALVQDGKVLCAVEEERFSRLKHGKNRPGLQPQRTTLGGDSILSERQRSPRPGCCGLFLRARATFEHDRDRFLPSQSDQGVWD